MEITGILKQKFETQVKSDKYSVREFVIETESTTPYPQKVVFQLSNKNCDLLNHFAEGQTVTVTFNLKGRMWTNPQGEVKYFNSLDAYKLTTD